MKLNIFLFLTILTLLTSCNGQASYQKKNSNQFTIGDTVKDLGSSIMVVYQDKAYKFNGTTFEKFSQ